MDPPVGRSVSSLWQWGSWLQLALGSSAFTPFLEQAIDRPYNRLMFQKPCDKVAITHGHSAGGAAKMEVADVIFCTERNNNIIDGGTAKKHIEMFNREGPPSNAYCTCVRGALGTKAVSVLAPASRPRAEE